MKLLDGFPLALEVVLANLARQSPQAVLDALRAGDVALDQGTSQSKTESIVRCIDYSHSNLAPEAQGLLACLAPFSAVLNTRVLSRYTDYPAAAAGPGAFALGAVAGSPGGSHRLGPAQSASRVS